MEKILVVDDDANHAKVVARALESKGYEITIAPDGQAGIDEMEKTPYDLVLTDLMMPGVDGDRLGQLIKNDPVGILLVDKPQGITSHDVVAKMRRVFQMKKIGHAGGGER